MKISSSVTLLSLLFLCSVSVAEEWTQYRGNQGDGRTAESIKSLDWKATPPEARWKATTPLGFSSFSVAADRAFTMVAVDSGDEKVEACLALNANTGDRLWQVTLGKSDYGHDGGNAGARNNRGGDGPRSTPATDGQRVYVYDSHLVLTCLNAKSGDILWQHDVVKEYAGRNIKWLNATSPVLDGDVIYVSGGGVGMTFLAFDKNSGELKWQSGDETITHATPRVANLNGKKQVVFFVQSGLVGVDAANGKELWRCKFPFAVSTAASPVTSGDQVYCSAGYGVGAGLFQVGDAKEAEELWFKPNKLMNHWSTPLEYEGHLFGLFEFKKYGKAPLNCVDMATGEIKWSQRGFGPGNCILVGKTLIVLSDAGEVVLVEANPNKYVEIARAKVLTGKCWSTPAYSNGRLFVRSTEEAVCLDLN